MIAALEAVVTSTWETCIGGIERVLDIAPVERLVPPVLRQKQPRRYPVGPRRAPDDDCSLPVTAMNC